jgi:hypothetical protein
MVKNAKIVVDTIILLNFVRIGELAILIAMKGYL